MFDELSIGFNADELISHWKHTSNLEGLALEDAIAVDQNCVICAKLENLNRHIKHLLPKPKKSRLQLDLSL